MSLSKTITFKIIICDYPLPMLRRWINDLNDYLPKWQRERLKEEADANGFEMVRKYQDGYGITRVSGA